jgi:excisionase family DNA binding protein
LLDIPQAAEFLRVSRTTVYALMDSGTLAYVRLPGVRARRIPKRALLALAEAGLTGGDSEAPAAEAPN